MHQFSKIGAHAFLADSAIVTRDVPPYVMVAGNPAAPHIGQHRGPQAPRLHASEQIRNIRDAYRILYRSDLKLAEALARARVAARRRTPEIRAVRRLHPRLHAQPGALNAAAARLASARALRVGIVAGEHSGDQLGAALIGALRERVPALECFGVAGPKMLAAGCRGLGRGR